MTAWWGCWPSSSLSGAKIAHRIAWLYRDQANAVVENFDKVEHVYGDECEQTPGCEAVQSPCRADCNPMPGFKYQFQELKRIALFHYVTRCVPATSCSCQLGEPGLRYACMTQKIVLNTLQFSVRREALVTSQTRAGRGRTTRER